MLDCIFSFIKNHWFGITFTISTTVAIAAGILPTLKWLSERRDRNWRIQTETLATAIYLHADLIKKQENKTNLIFSDDEIRDWHLGTPREFLVQAAMEVLRRDGRARKTKVPGYWEIN